MGKNMKIYTFLFACLVLLANIACSSSVKKNANLKHLHTKSFSLMSPIGRMPTSIETSNEKQDKKNLGQLGLKAKKKGDTSKAHDLFTKACNAGDMMSCGNLGIMEYEKGEVSKALELYKKSCYGGFSMSCVNLGGIGREQGRPSQGPSFLYPGL